MKTLIFLLAWGAVLKAADIPGEMQDCVARLAQIRHDLEVLEAKRRQALAELHARFDQGRQALFQEETQAERRYGRSLAAHLPFRHRLRQVAERVQGRNSYLASALSHLRTPQDWEPVVEIVLEYVYELAEPRRQIAGDWLGLFGPVLGFEQIAAERGMSKELVEAYFDSILIHFSQNLGPQDRRKLNLYERVLRHMETQTPWRALSPEQQQRGWNWPLETLLPEKILVNLQQGFVYHGLDLIRRTPRELGAIQGIGPLSVRRIQAALSQRGMSLYEAPSTP